MRNTAALLMGMIFFVSPMVEASDPLGDVRDLLKDCIGPVIFDYYVKIKEPDPWLPNSGEASDYNKGDFGKFYYVSPLYGGKHLYNMHGSTVKGACADEPKKATAMLAGDPYIFNPILCQNTSVCDPHD